MPLRRRRVSKDVMDRYAADEKLAGTYRDKLAAVAEAEQVLRDAQNGDAGDTADADRHGHAIALDMALTEAVLAAEAAERVATGPKTYAPADAKDADKARVTADIERRKAKAKPQVKPWTGEVDRLRTAREAHRLSFRVGPGVAV